MDGDGVEGSWGGAGLGIGCCDGGGYAPGARWSARDTATREIEDIYLYLKNNANILINKTIHSSLHECHLTRHSLH